ncbi:hypothetical protein H7X68_01950 [Candidatus Saccharibacteria bacterium]|nr:hypothetical protein [Candidatus Saccharibacteria bacterium]
MDVRDMKTLGRSFEHIESAVYNPDNLLLPNETSIVITLSPPADGGPDIRFSATHSMRHPDDLTADFILSVLDVSGLSVYRPIRSVVSGEERRTLTFYYKKDQPKDLVATTMRIMEGIEDCIEQLDTCHRRRQRAAARYSSVS